jgi:hypothetical protein
MTLVASLHPNHPNPESVHRYAVPHCSRLPVRVWNPAIRARLKGKFFTAKQYYHDLGLDTSLLNSSGVIRHEDAGKIKGYRPNKLGTERIGRFKRPMAVTVVTRNKATIDDCEFRAGVVPLGGGSWRERAGTLMWSHLRRMIGDFNMHLSNSSYAKVRLRFRWNSGYSAPLTADATSRHPHGQNLDPARMKACVELFSPFFPPGGWMALGGESVLLFVLLPGP